MARASIVYPAGRAGVANASGRAALVNTAGHAGILDRVATAALGLYARATDPLPLPVVAQLLDAYLTPDGSGYYAPPTGDSYYAQPL